MFHLISVQHLNKAQEPTMGYPYHIPVIRTLDTLRFDTPVTFFVGENGTGKSTLLEAIAANIGSVTVSDKSIERDESFESARKLSKVLSLSWKIKTRKGLFLRAEDFIRYTRMLSELRKEMEEEINKVNKEYANKSKFAHTLAQIPYQRSIFELDKKYQGDLEHKSHGESFLDFFQARFVPSGLYLLDEPEAPLSPLKQLGLLAMIKDMVAQNAQFIIATHSPILMAYPNARIYSFDGGTIHQTEYNQLEHVRLTRDFLNNPTQFLRFL